MSKQQDDNKIDDQVAEETGQPGEDQVDQVDELKILEDKVAHLEDQLKRAVADYQNLEKRVQSDSLAVAQFLKAQALVRMISVLDHLEQALDGAGEEEKKSGWFKGVEMAVKEFKKILSDEGLIEVETSGKFDPRLHEAVDVKEGEQDKILQVMQKGYMVGDKVVRPAKVIVGKKEK